MSQASYEAVVVGGGPGGYVCALRLGRLGIKTAIVEGQKLGGVCLNHGCIPTKALQASAAALRTARNLDRYGLDRLSPTFDYARVVARKDEIVARLRRGVEQLLRGSGVDLFWGWAHAEEPGELRLELAGGEQRRLRYENLVLATGSEALKPSVFAYDGQTVLTSRELLSLSELPGRLLIVGGGYIGCEVAQITATFGSQVTVVEQQKQLLPGFPKAYAARLQAAFRREGIKVYTGDKVEAIERSTGEVQVKLAGGDLLPADRVLLAVGRRPALRGIKPAGLGLDLLENDAVKVDPYMRTSVPGVYAVGDVTGRTYLAHVAMREGVVAAENIAASYGRAQEVRMSYAAIPSCVFTDPPLANVRSYENIQEVEGDALVRGVFPYSASGKAAAMGETTGQVELQARSEDGRLLGGYVMGAGAPELVAELTLAASCGLSLRDVATTVHAHPTLSEAVMEAAALALGEGVHLLPRK